MYQNNNKEQPIRGDWYFIATRLKAIGVNISEGKIKLVQDGIFFNWL